MLAEVLSALRPGPAMKFVDGTVGMGGHAEALLSRSAPDGWLWGCDRDADAIEAARERLAAFAGRYELVRGNFADMAAWVPGAACDGVLLDLGVSSPQLDRADRGFSFQAEGPLDMRMDRRQALTAEQLVNEMDTEALARMFRELGDEPDARRIAREIDRERRVHRIATTAHLASVVGRCVGRRGRRHPATRVFQALRVATNDELGALHRGLQAALTVLKPGGRLVTLSFQSLEERMVKRWGREMVRDYDVVGDVDVPELRQPRPARMRWVTRHALLPGEAETASNPRARSAQMRALEKI